MLLFGHLGIPLGAAEAAERLVPRLAGRLDYRLVALGSFLPDLVDKPLGMVVLRDSLGNGRIISHSLLFPLSFFLAGMVLRRFRWSLLVLSLAMLGHLVGDQMWLEPRTLLFPLYGWSFPRLFIEDFIGYLLHNLFTQPDVYIPEIVGFLVLVRLGFRAVWHRGLTRLLETGRF